MRKIIISLGAIAVLTTGCNPAQDPVAVQSSGPDKPAGKSGGATAKKTFPIRLTAKQARAGKSILSDGGALSCVKVTVTNQTKKQLEVNPLYFSITDTHNTKHDSTSALGDYDGQIDTTTLAPHEKATGLVCAKGSFRPKVVAMTNPLFSEAARAQVAS